MALHSLELFLSLSLSSVWVCRLISPVFLFPGEILVFFDKEIGKFLEFFFSHCKLDYFGYFGLISPEYRYKKYEKEITAYLWFFFFPLWFLRYVGNRVFFSFPFLNFNFFMLPNCWWSWTRRFYPNLAIDQLWQFLKK